MRNPIYAAIFFSLLLTTCSRGPDPGKEFGIYVNGKPLGKALGEPVGLIQELEAGYSYSYRYSIVFPLKISAARGVPRPGLLIEFDPARIEPGREIAFDGGMESPVRVEYHPLTGHRPNQAQMLAYSSGHGSGGGIIRFDLLETQPGARIKGSLVQATLYGYYENMETMELSEPSKPGKLELYNWSFDITLQRSIF